MGHVTNRNAALPIRNREPFTNSTESFRGTDHTVTYGILPRDLWDNLETARRTAGFYVVYSYQTPIAWYNSDTEEWTVPDVRYSVATSRHQSAVRVGISAPASYFERV